MCDAVPCCRVSENFVALDATSKRYTAAVAPLTAFGRVARIERHVLPEIDPEIGLRMDHGQSTLAAIALLREQRGRNLRAELAVVVGSTSLSSPRHGATRPTYESGCDDEEHRTRCASFTWARPPLATPRSERPL